MNRIVTEQMMNDWLQHRMVLEELLESVGDVPVDFKPYESAMTFGELALHVAGWNDVFLNLVKTEKFAPPAIPECKTMEEVRQAVRHFTAQTKAGFESITDEDLDAPNGSAHPKLKGPKKNYLKAMYDHEIHHKGQLYTYARMIGAKELPFFR